MFTQKMVSQRTNVTAAAKDKKSSDWCDQEENLAALD
jgi:hypothetical protein